MRIGLCRRVQGRPQAAPRLAPSVATPALSPPPAETGRRSAASTAERVIQPPSGGVFTQITDAWRQRELIPFFGRRCAEKMYMRTWLGWPWLVLRPGIDLAMKVAVLGTLLGSPSPNIPYLLYALVGLTIFQLFEKIAFWATRAIEINRSILRKVHASRLAVIVGSMVPASILTSIYVAVLVGAVGIYAIADGTTYLQVGANTPALLAGVGLTITFGLAIGCFTAVWAARARDVRFTLNYILGFWFFVTPVLYPPDHFGGAIGTIVHLNPMTAPVEFVKHGLLGTGMPDTMPVISCLTVVGALTVAGLAYLARTEAMTADTL